MSIYSFLSLLIKQIFVLTTFVKNFFEVNEAIENGSGETHAQQRAQSKLFNVKKFTEILNFTRANKHILDDFKQHYNEWSQKFSAEWRSYQSVKLNAIHDVKLSPFVRILSSAILSMCVLECYRTSNLSYLILGLGFYQSLKVMKSITVFAISYFCSENEYESMVRQYFGDISSVVQCFVNRLTTTHEDNFMLKSSLAPDLHLDTLYDVPEMKLSNSYSMFSPLDVLGVMMAFVASSLRSYFEHQHFSSLEVVSMHFTMLAFLIKDSNASGLINEVKRKRKIMKTLTEEFVFWFKNKCQLKRVLQESNLSCKTLIETLNSSEFSKEAKYLNNAISVAVCEKILDLNLPKHDLEEVTSLLMYDVEYKSLVRSSEVDDKSHLISELKNLLAKNSKHGKSSTNVKSEAGEKSQNAFKHQTDFKDFFISNKDSKQKNRRSRKKNKNKLNQLHIKSKSKDTCEEFEKRSDRDFQLITSESKKEKEDLSSRTLLPINGKEEDTALCPGSITQNSYLSSGGNNHEFIDKNISQSLSADVDSDFGNKVDFDKSKGKITESCFPNETETLSGTNDKNSTAIKDERLHVEHKVDIDKNCKENIVENCSSRNELVTLSGKNDKNSKPAKEEGLQVENKVDIDKNCKEKIEGNYSPRNDMETLSREKDQKSMTKENESLHFENKTLFSGDQVIPAKCELKEASFIPDDMAKYQQHISFEKNGLTFASFELDDLEKIDETVRKDPKENIVENCFARNKAETSRGKENENLMTPKFEKLSFLRFKKETRSLNKSRLSGVGKGIQPVICNLLKEKDESEQLQLERKKSTEMLLTENESKKYVEKKQPRMNLC